jgi:hypothetical protein
MQPGNESTLKEVIEQLLENYKLQDGLTRAKLVGSWDKIAGKFISQQTENIFVKNKKLYLKLSSPALKHELSFAKSKLITTLNQSIGQEVIEDIVFL